MTDLGEWDITPRAASPSARTAWARWLMWHAGMVDPVETPRPPTPPGGRTLGRIIRIVGTVWGITIAAAYGAAAWLAHGWAGLGIFGAVMLIIAAVAVVVEWEIRMDDADVAAERARRHADPIVDVIAATGFPIGYPVDRDRAADATCRGWNRISTLRADGIDDTAIARVICGSRHYWGYCS